MTTAELRKAWEQHIDELLSLPMNSSEFRRKRKLVQKAFKQYQRACQQEQAQYEAAIRRGKAL